MSVKEYKGNFKIMHSFKAALFWSILWWWRCNKYGEQQQQLLPYDTEPTNVNNVEQIS